MKRNTFILVCLIGMLSTSFKDVREKKEQFCDPIIHGVVKDKHGDPLAGVTVIRVGTSSGVITNIYGEYSIVVDVALVKLRFSTVGCVSQDIGTNVSSCTSVIIIDVEMECD